ncbi:Hypothetical predicted protein [Mytilus galloprovincialis]|uniref:Mab-21-like HhH/H2TH-like domain-containing protein n=1 Tax=Mytilus galloprovincialis TaxID=29158 RepID=A0A8B6G1N8_MYTGA|nr:Hypothetical predicted protein [Mytilus galloprovincialis]
MDRNSKNKNDSSDENLFDMMKTTYWEIYGVKRFPYRGKRKFTPLLSQSLDGGMVISNDVFGLTISQFERMYKACLERRRSKEQWILNLRYPDKSSKEYLEYLENCTDCNKGNMDRNSRSINKSNFSDENLFEMKKTTYWEIYDVKRFPYRGKRKFTPLLSQSIDGGMVISNDVFGLTISQFERMYKACLERRKTKEQWIINLRYPDKSSKEYLEYLENCTDCNKDHLPWIDPREHHLYEHLVNIVGSEIDIRKRHRLFIIIDMIFNSSGLGGYTQIFSGSLAEGLDLPGSDMDVMYVSKSAKIIQKEKNILIPVNGVYVMETDIDHPGFARLRQVATSKGKSLPEKCERCPTGSCTGKRRYLLTSKFLTVHMQENTCIHGPCISDIDQTIDRAFCIRSKYLPHNAMPWSSRHGRQWPPSFVIDRIVKYGCLLVPVGPKISSDDDSLWRISFSVAERLLVHSFNFTQLLCYGLLKLTLKRIINTNDKVNDLLCSYFLKTEEIDIDTFQLSKIYHCFFLCLDKLISWVNTCYCPNYFIPEQNMFLGKIDQSNNKILLCVLQSIQCGGIDGLIHNLFPLENEHHRLISTKREFSFIPLDFLLYRTTTLLMMNTIPKDILIYYKTLSCIYSLLKSESSTFIIDSCKLYKYYISQFIVQLLPSPITIGNTIYIRKCYHRHLQNGTKTDSVSGWLLYASFYYVIGQFNDTLKITDYVLGRWSPYMLLIDFDSNDTWTINYKYNVHSFMTVNERMTLATAQHVHYVQHSQLIPEELQLEVEHSAMNILPNVMSYCLRFLCYHHLGDIPNKRQALRDLDITVKDNVIISNDAVSHALTLLGVCFEISGDKDMAYQCYEEALQCDSFVCPSAEARKLKLLKI